MNTCPWCVPSIYVIDVVALVPAYINNAQGNLAGRLSARLAAPVSLRVRQTLEANEDGLRNRADIDGLRLNVASLSAETRALRVEMDEIVAERSRVLREESAAQEQGDGSHSADSLRCEAPLRSSPVLRLKREDGPGCRPHPRDQLYVMVTVIGRLTVPADTVARLCTACAECVRRRSRGHLGRSARATRAPLWCTAARRRCQAHLEQLGIAGVGSAIETQGNPRHQRVTLADHNIHRLERRGIRAGEQCCLIAAQIDVGHGDAATPGRMVPVTLNVVVVCAAAWPAASSEASASRMGGRRRATVHIGCSLSCVSETVMGRVTRPAPTVAADCRKRARYGYTPAAVVYWVRPPGAIGTLTAPTTRTSSMPTPGTPGTATRCCCRPHR